MPSRPRTRRIASALALLAVPAGAQPARLTVEPLVGYRGPSDLYRHEVDNALVAERGPGGVVSRERLRLDGGVGVGTRVAVGVGGSWTAHVEGMRWASRHTLDTRVDGYGTAAGPGSWSSWESGASVLTVSAGVARDLWAPGDRTRVSAEFSGGWTRASLARLTVPRLAPSLGTSPPGLGRYEAVEARYDVPSTRLGLGASRALRDRVALRARAGLTLGRVDTRSFRIERIPGFEFAEEPTRHLARAVDATLGAVVRLR